ncbi:MAG: serine--tRNA ligase, partial [Desulfuromonadales bacterium]
MLDLKYLRENLDDSERRLATRGGELDLSAFRELDRGRRDLLGESEALKAEKNRVSAVIGQTRDKSSVQGEIARMKEVSARIKSLDEELKEVEERLQGLLLSIPNIPHERCPVGASEEENREVRRWGEVPSFDFDPKPHWEL